MDIHDKLAEQKKIAFIWSIEDLQGLDDTLSDQDAWEILQRFESHHEGSMDSMWYDLSFHIDDYKGSK